MGGFHESMFIIIAPKQKAESGRQMMLSAFQTQSNFPVIIAIFTSPIAFVILISRGQASVQL